MRKSPSRRITLDIIVSDDRHCSNDCPGMSDDAGRCLFFQEPLTWNKRRKVHGNVRLAQCVRAEKTPLQAAAAESPRSNSSSDSY